MGEPHEQQKAHPLEEVTGERDVHPEEDPQQAASRPDTSGEGADGQDQGGSGAGGEAET
jgi:hypothetical protein